VNVKRSCTFAALVVPFAVTVTSTTPAAWGGAITVSARLVDLTSVARAPPSANASSALR